MAGDHHAMAGKVESREMARTGAEHLLCRLQRCVQFASEMGAACAEGHHVALRTDAAAGDDAEFDHEVQVTGLRIVEVVRLARFE